MPVEALLDVQRSLFDHVFSCHLLQLEEGGKVENVQVQRCRARLEHLGSVADADRLDDWKDARLNRILVDYLLRMSYYDSAKNLEETADIQVLSQR